LTVAGDVFHPRDARVAGVPIDLGGTKYRLLRCTGCDFMWKDPPIDPSKLNACYTAAGAGHWGYTVEARERRFDVIASALGEPGGRSILDVGCANGAFLQYLGPTWKLFGVEPSVAAAAVAMDRGVTILGKTLDDAVGHRFDVIITMDVVEHIPDPRPFFATAASMLNPGGMLVTLTGDTSSVPWRVLTSRYWYCGLAEHVSFHCPRSLDVLGEQVGMRRKSNSRLAHHLQPMRANLSQLARCSAYLLLRGLARLGLPPARRMTDHRNAPAILCLPDHLLHVLQKSG
jgi:SAM-dependent methyltransferase